MENNIVTAIKEKKFAGLEESIKTTLSVKAGQALTEMKKKVNEDEDDKDAECGADEDQLENGDTEDKKEVEEGRTDAKVMMRDPSEKEKKYTIRVSNVKDRSDAIKRAGEMALKKYGKNMSVYDTEFIPVKEGEE